MRTLVVDFKDFDAPQALHAFLASHLDFPAYYGNNLDALYDVLVTDDRKTNLIALPSGREWEERFLRVFRDASKENPNFSVGVRG